MNPSDTKPSLPQAKITFRVLYNDEIAMGPGKADLLAEIEKTGSISAAGRSMGMSYRRAWMLVDVMNRCFAQPLVHTAKGGKDGGGATLTPLGRQVLQSYKQMVVGLNSTVQAFMPVFSGMMKTPEHSDTEENDVARM
jgi:molybdate transport system regulatory protein